MFRNIVVGYDGSPQADRGIDLASWLAGPSGGNVALVNAIPFFRTFSYPLNGLSYPEEVRHRAQTTLRRGAARVGTSLAWETEVRADASVASALLDAAQERNADLIALGATHHGQGGRTVGRAVVQRLLHQARCAVAVAAPDGRTLPETGVRITVAYDGSAAADAALDGACEIAAARQGSIHLCGVPHSPVLAEPAERGGRLALTETDLRRRIDAKVDEVGDRLPVRGTVLHGSVLPTLADAAARGDLLVVGTRARSLVRRAIAGSVAAGLLNRAQVPVIVEREPAEVAADQHEGGRDAISA